MGEEEMAYKVKTSKNGKEVDKVVVVVNQGCVGWWRNHHMAAPAGGTKQPCC